VTQCQFSVGLAFFLGNYKTSAADVVAAVLVLFNLVHPGTCLPFAFTRFRLDKKRLVDMSKAPCAAVPQPTYNYAMT
jgi:hypothetical protein